MKLTSLSFLIVSLSPALVASPAPAAAAAEAPPVIAQQPAAPSARFGARGSAVVDAGLLSVTRSTVAGIGGASANISGSLRLSAFVANNWSVGLSLGGSYLRSTFNGAEASARGYSVAAWTGHLVPITPLLSLWPQLGAGVSRTTVDATDPSVVVATGGGTMVSATLEVPLLLHASRYFFVALGPGVFAVVTAQTQSAFLGVRASFGCSFDLD